MKRFLIALGALLCIAAAGDPTERLPDPAQEARARELFREIRCVVCQNESIDDSEAMLAGDLRRVVREQVKAGRSDAEIRAYLVDRYGEFVLLKPSFGLANLALWTTPFALLLIAGGLILWRARRAGAEIGADSLSPEEERALATLTEPQQAGHALAPTPSENTEG